MSIMIMKMASMVRSVAAEITATMSQPVAPTSMVRGTPTTRVSRAYAPSSLDKGKRRLFAEEDTFLGESPSWPLRINSNSYFHREEADLDTLGIHALDDGILDVGFPKSLRSLT